MVRHFLTGIIFLPKIIKLKEDKLTYSKSSSRNWTHSSLLLHAFSNQEENNSTCFRTPVIFVLSCASVLHLQKYWLKKNEYQIKKKFSILPNKKYNTKRFVLIILVLSKICERSADTLYVKTETLFLRNW